MKKIYISIARYSLYITGPKKANYIQNSICGVICDSVTLHVHFIFILKEKESYNSDV